MIIPFLQFSLKRSTFRAKNRDFPFFAFPIFPSVGIAAGLLI